MDRTPLPAQARCARPYCGHMRILHAVWKSPTTGNPEGPAACRVSTLLNPGRGINSAIHHCDCGEFVEEWSGGPTPLPSGVDLMWWLCRDCGGSSQAHAHSKKFWIPGRHDYVPRGQDPRLSTRLIAQVEALL